MDFKVIVKINESNAHLYNALFAKAYQALDAKGKIMAEAKNDAEKRFKNLNHYLAHADALLELDPAYLLLPLDEPTFDINADSRNIKASRIVILQNDHNAETIQFTVDRYFDYMDLKEARIYAQWTLPSGKEGATWVDEAKDLSIPGKIRFGWPLTADVTSEPGIVKYSIRFWNRSLNNASGKEEVEYSFNTLTSSLTISPSLQPSVNGEADVVAPVKSGFARAVRNSQIVLEGRDLPLAPYFFKPGMDLPSYASLDVDTNTLVLKAQAGVGDTGTLAYHWYFKPAIPVTLKINSKDVTFNNETFYPYDDVMKKDAQGRPTTTVEVYGFKHFNGQIKDGNGAGRDLFMEEYNWVAAGKLNIGDRYFKEDGSAYESTIVPEDKSVKLYEKYTTYSIPAGEEKVTGQYKVCATNTIEPNTTAEMPSTVCQLISPDDIVITADLEPIHFISEDDKVPTKPLKVSIKSQTSSDVNVIYDWIVGTDSSTPDEDVADAPNAAQFIPTTPGWYQLHMEATLNRETKENDSKVCKVTFAPKLPTIAYGPTATSKLQDHNGTRIPTYTTADDAVLDLAITDPNPSGVDKNLYTDEYKFEWYVSTPTSTIRKVNDKDDFYVSGLNTSTLTVKNPTDGAIHTYKCIVTNYLSGKSISDTLNNAKPFYVM